MDVEEKAFLKRSSQALILLSTRESDSNKNSMPVQNCTSGTSITMHDTNDTRSVSYRAIT